jgi:hypothetical protein
MKIALSIIGRGCEYIHKRSLTVWHAKAVVLEGK